MDWTAEDSIPTRIGDFSGLQNGPTVSGAHPASNSSGTGNFFLRVKTTEA
jgi:hypothetical protein